MNAAVVDAASRLAGVIKSVHQGYRKIIGNDVFISILYIFNINKSQTNIY